jgi:rubrerythrin
MLVRQGADVMDQRPIESIESFYAHAIAIEREACERYREFKEWFEDRGEDVLAGLCAGIGGMEEEHCRELVEASRHLSLPALAQGEHCWLESGSPEAPARELFYRVAEPHHLLEIALKGELDALAFFQGVGRTATDAGVRAAAQEMARDEERHAAWVGNVLEYHLTTRATDWDELIRHGRGPGAFVGAEGTAS